MELPDREKLQKLYIPAGISEKTRSRLKLLHALREVSSKPHTFLIAKSGSGRTVSVLRRLGERACTVAWITFEGVDNTPGVFFTRLALAFLALQPGNAPLAERLRLAKLDASPVSLARDAAFCLTAENENAALVLDCFEHITDEEIIRELVSIIRVLQGGFSVVFVSCEEPHGLLSDLILRNLMSVIKTDKVIF